jgi:hypothetical protein
MNVSPNVPQKNANATTATTIDPRLLQYIVSELTKNQLFQLDMKMRMEKLETSAKIFKEELLKLNPSFLKLQMYIGGSTRKRRRGRQHKSTRRNH